MNLSLVALSCMLAVSHGVPVAGGGDDAYVDPPPPYGSLGENMRSSDIANAKVELSSENNWWKLSNLFKGYEKSSSRPTDSLPVSHVATASADELMNGIIDSQGVGNVHQAPIASALHYGSHRSDNVADSSLRQNQEPLKQSGTFNSIAETVRNSLSISLDPAAALDKLIKAIEADDFQSLKSLYAPNTALADALAYAVAEQRVGAVRILWARVSNNDRGSSDLKQHLKTLNAEAENSEINEIIDPVHPQNDAFGSNTFSNHRSNGDPPSRGMELPMYNN